RGRDHGGDEQHVDERVVELTGEALEEGAGFVLGEGVLPVARAAAHDLVAPDPRLRIDPDDLGHVLDRHGMEGVVEALVSVFAHLEGTAYGGCASGVKSGPRSRRGAKIRSDSAVKRRSTSPSS